MRKIPIVAILFLVLFASCSKGNDNDYYVRFSVNGTQKNYTSHTLGHIETKGSIYCP